MTILLIYLLIVLIPYAASFAFNLTDIEQNNLEIVPEGVAYVSREGIYVTPNEDRGVPYQKGGRVKYKTPLHLWDRNSNELASFSTYFTFVIDPKSNSSHSDGLTFFLAEDNSLITGGGAIGLPVNNETHAMMYRFVAVEFDTFGFNEWDPKYSNGQIIGADHVGINNNSLSSSRYQTWNSNITSGVDCQAWINYDSVSQNLSVSWTCLEHNKADRRQDIDSKYELVHHIDLKEVLPEWVIFGFSVATGGYFETYLITSWSFTSSDIQIDRAMPPYSSPKSGSGQPPITSPKNSSGQPPTTRNSYIHHFRVSLTPLQVKNGSRRHQLMLGLLLVGSFVLVTFLAIVAFVLWRKKKNKHYKKSGY